MKQKTIRFIVSFLLLFTSQVLATQFKSGENFVIDDKTKIPDDLIFTGNSVQINGTISGDLIGACKILSFNGRTEGSLMAACQKLEVTGITKGSVRSFAQEISISGTVERNLIAFCQSLSIKKEALIKGDITAFCAELYLDGTVNKGVTMGKVFVAKEQSVTVSIGSGDVYISGTVNGDLDIRAEKLTILPTAVINGNLSYKSAQPAKIEPGAKITGETKWKKIESKKAKKKGFRKITPFNLVLFLASLLTGIILIALFKKGYSKAKNEVWASFLKSLGLGFILSICVPIGCVILLITLIGIPISGFALLLYLFIFYIGKLIVATAIGEKIIFLWKKDKKVSLYWSLVLGMVIFYILTGIPYLGFWIYLFSFFIGFGAIVLGLRKKEVTA